LERSTDGPGVWKFPEQTIVADHLEHQSTKQRQALSARRLFVRARRDLEIPQMKALITGKPSVKTGL
jgi:hypothetical protein